MEAPPPPQDPDELWHDTKVISLSYGKLSELPENPSCPTLKYLYLKNNPDLTEIPPSFFLAMPKLHVLNLSYTSIKYLPRSIFSLFGLRQLSLRGCELLMELPPEIGALRYLEALDLQGTELICLPNEIKQLSQLKWFYVTFYASRLDQYKGFKAFIPQSTLSKFSELEELVIDENQEEECESYWDVECEAVIRELASLDKLRRLELFFPTVELLQQFLQLPCRRKREWCPDTHLVYQTLVDFKLTVGRDQQHVITSCLPKGLQDERLNRCLEYVNGEGSTDGIGKALERANALFLDRHWTIESLSVFKPDETRQLNCCLLVQCNEMKTIVDGGGDDDHLVDRKAKETNGFESLQYLSIHCMKNLESICKGPRAKSLMTWLKVLALHTCPKLSTIFDIGLLRNLICLKQLIVEECPQVQGLVKMESSSGHLEYDEDDDHSKFLPNIEKITLLHLPELVSIFNGLIMAPRLERMVVYNCPKLKNLSPVASKCIKEIKGEREWWEALEWPSKQVLDKLARVFVPLARDGDLMDQLEEARSSINNLRMIQTQWINQVLKLMWQTWSRRV